MGKKFKLVKKSKIRVISSCLLVVLLFLSPASFIFDLVVQSGAKESEQALKYTFCFEKPVLKDWMSNDKTFTQVSITNCLSHGKPGNPALPVYPVKILLPQGKKATDINVLYSGIVEIECDLSEKPIMPQQQPVSIGIKQENVPFLMNADVYNSMEPIVDETYINKDIGFCRGYTILSVTLNPLQYVPGEGKVFYHPEMTISIELEEAGYVNQFYRNNPDDKAWVENLVYNPEIANIYPANAPTFDYPDGLCDPGDDYDYVIITTTYNGLDHWEVSGNTPYNWTSLMDKHLTDDGLNCTLVTIQDINNCSDYWNDTALFNDTAAHIREFCKDAYQDWGTSYILIGGDDEWISAREMDYAYESDVDSDLYWSNLDNTFNDDQDSLWGEAGDAGFDLYSEIYIGRLTCDEPQDVSNWMNKSFYYADSNDRNYLDNAAFYGGDTTWNCQGDDFIEYSAINGTSNWLGPTPGAHGSYPSWLGFHYGFETWNNENPSTQFNLSVKWTAEPPNTGWAGGDEATAKAGLKGDINNDQVTLISAIAHANEYMSLDVSYSTWESDYHNTKPFFIHDYGCHCGDMDAADDGVLHSMLFHSDTELAFACIYNTGYGWGSYDDTNSSSALQQKLFWDYFFDTTNNSRSTSNWQLGKAMAYSKDSMAPTINWTYGGAPGSWRATIQCCLLFGDPAQRIKILSNESLVLNNENPSNGSTNVEITPTLSVTVDDANNGVLNSTWCSNSSGSWVQFATNSSIDTIGGAVNIIQSNSNFSSYNTTYWWSVNLTNGTIWLNETYYFTTRAQYIPSPPGSFTATKYNRSRIGLSWTNAGANKTYIEWNTTESWPRGSGNIIYNDTGTNHQHTDLSFGTTYYYQAWSWNDTDNCWSTSNSSDNATTDNNTAPSLSGENPLNGSMGVDKSQSTVNVTITDADGDSFNWTIQGQYVTDFGANGASDGSKSANLITPLPYDTEIVWYVNVTDGNNSTNATYNFTVRSQYIPSSPGSFTATKYNRSRIDLSWTNADVNKTYIEYNTSSDTWAWGEGTFLDNSTNTSYQHTNLSFGTTYYYQAWSWNETDSCWSATNVSDNATTDDNAAPSLSGENPSNESTGQQRWPACNITVTDIDDDSMTVYFYENTTGSWVSQQINSSIADGTNIIWNNFTNASNFSTVYWWSVNVSDGYNWTNETYYFITVENQAPSISDITPSNGSTGISISTSTLSVNITDTEGDNFNWTIETSPNIGNSSGNNASSGVKTCSMSGLGYYTTYYWYVSVIDTGNGSWVNMTYHFKTEQQSTGNGGDGGDYIPPPQNNAPETPSTPNGPTTGYTNVTYNYTTNGTDPDNDKIKYKFDWGDGNISDWTDLIDPGTEISLPYSWSSNGTYHVKAMTKDENGGESDWSDSITVLIYESSTFEEPETDGEIVIDIPESKTSNQSVVFNVLEINGFDDENLSYHWDFGDGTNGTGKQPNHTYKAPGTYIIVLEIYDSNGSLVNTTTFEVTIYAEGEIPSQDTKRDSEQEQTYTSLFWIMLLGGLIIVLLVLFRNNIKSVFLSHYKKDLYETQIKNLKIGSNNFKKINIEPKKSPFTMLDEYYNYDITQPKFDEKSEKNVIELDHEKSKIDQKRKHIIKFIDDILTKDNNKEK